MFPESLKLTFDQKLKVRAFWRKFDYTDELDCCMSGDIVYRVYTSGIGDSIIAHYRNDHRCCLTLSDDDGSVLEADFDAAWRAMPDKR